MNEVKVGDLVEMDGYFFAVTCVEGTRVSMRELGVIEEAELSEVKKVEWSEFGKVNTEEDAEDTEDAEEVAKAL